jgi:hypothetical protein
MCAAARSYLYYDGTPLFPFGYGLSYTTFAFTWLTAASAPCEVDVATLAAVGPGALPPYAVNVTNTGSVTSDVSVLAFVSSGVPGEPISALFDFQRAASVAPGQSVVLEFTLPPALAAVVAVDGSRVLVPGTTLVCLPAAPRARAPPRSKPRTCWGCSSTHTLTIIPGSASDSLHRASSLLCHAVPAPCFVQTIRIGDVPPSRFSSAVTTPASRVETSVTLTGRAPHVLSRLPPRHGAGQ